VRSVPAVDAHAFLGADVLGATTVRPDRFAEAASRLSVAGGRLNATIVVTPRAASQFRRF